MKADLHLHTTASDGRLEPEEIVLLAAKVGLDVIAITDHDTIDGVAPALINAVHNALGIWFHDLPLTPEKVIKGIKK